MISAEKHQKVLELLTELERGSINFFDVEQEFFLIDSENLAKVKPRLYGYSIQADGIYEEDNLTPEAVDGLDGRGCYVYVDVRGGQITIQQDLNGCWGIYLFRRGNYFALSNSFFRLLDHVKFLQPLTINRDYCNHLMVNTLTSHAYSETAVNEIELIERHMIIHIDIAEKSLQLEPIDYKERSLTMDSPEGIATLDSWVELWGKVFRGVTQHSNFFTADLSGGFDTRTPFLLMLNSGIDCNKVSFHSIKDASHAEDYAISSKIAENYGLTLNTPLPEARFLNYSMFDTWNIDLYCRQTFKKNPGFFYRKNIDKQYSLNGYAGETMRGNWFRFNLSPNEFINLRKKVGTRKYSPDLSNELSGSIEKILKSAFRSICNKYKIEDTTLIELVQYLYQETRCRSHFGKNMVSRYLKNTVVFAPALDPLIRKLRIDIPECPDPRLLIALIFARYEPKLLTFPFQGNRSIVPETIAVAQKINERFPRHLTPDKVERKEIFHLLPRDARAEKILDSGQNNRANAPATVLSLLQTVFNSSKTYGLFTSYFDSEIYDYAANFYANNTSNRDSYSYSICGIAKVLEDVNFSRRNHPLYRDAKRFLEEDFAIVHVPE